MRYFAPSFRLAKSFAVFALLGLFVVGAADPSYAGKNVALVIGNSAYKKAGALTNPKNDAAAIGQLLQNAGFTQVEIRHDLDYLEFRRVLRNFSAQARDADIALIFFAGHGLEVGGANYLLPVDAAIERDIDVQDETVSVDRLTSTIESAKRLRLIILDACRDNPFAATMQRTAASRAISRGLVKEEPPSDTLIAFAAKAGSTASDGQDGNSPFTKALLKHLAVPGLDIRIALGRVRDEVMQNTRPKQEPFVYGSLGGATVALVDPPAAPEPIAKKQEPVPPSVNPSSPALETLAAEAARAWRDVAETTNCRILDTYIKRFGATFHGELARDRLELLNGCQKVAVPEPKVVPKPETPAPPQKAALPEKPAPVAPAPVVKVEPALKVEPAPKVEQVSRVEPLPRVEPALKPERPSESAASQAIPAFCRSDRPGSGDAAIGGPLVPIRLQPNLSTAKEFRAIRFASDGSRFATAGDDRIVRLWDAKSFQMIRELRGHTGEVYSIDFSVDGKMLASTGFDGAVRVWSVPSGELLHVFRTEATQGAVRQFGVAFYPGSDSAYVDSVGADGQVWIWDLQRKRLDRKRAAHDDSSDTTIRTISFSPRANGEFISGGFDGTIRRFLTNGKIEALKAHTGKVLQVAYSPAGDRIASAGVDTGSALKVWSASDRRLLRTFDGHKGYVVSVAWSKDGRRIASGGGAQDRTVRVWDVETGRQIHLMTGHAADIESVAFHPNGKWVVSASEDKTVKVWNLDNGKEVLTLTAFEDSQYLAYLPNGCHTGSADAQRFLRVLSKDGKGTERDLPDRTKASLFLPVNSLSAIIGN